MGVWREERALSLCLLFYKWGYGGRRGRCLSVYCFINGGMEGGEGAVSLFTVL